MKSDRTEKLSEIKESRRLDAIQRDTENIRMTPVPVHIPSQSEDAILRQNQQVAGQWSAVVTAIMATSRNTSVMTNDRERQNRMLAPMEIAEINREGHNRTPVSIESGNSASIGSRTN